MTVNTATLLNFLAPKLDNTIKSKIDALSVDGKVDLSTALKDKSIQDILNSLAKDLLSGLKTKNQINNLLMSNKHVFDIKNTTTDIKQLLTQIEQNPKYNNQTQIIKQFLVDINNLDIKSLKSNIAKSGVFLESDLASNKNVSNDIKAVLLQLQQDMPDNTKIDKLINQIEYFQLLSYTSNTNQLYLPFVWNNLEDGDIKFSTNDDENISCNINLQLQNYGQFKAMLLLDKQKNLNLNMSIEDDELKRKIQENLQLLRQSITESGLNIQNLNIFTMTSKEQLSYEEKAYSQGEQIDFGVDIKA